MIKSTEVRCPTIAGVVRILVSCLVLCLASGRSAQTSAAPGQACLDAPEGQRIGLVLSGGGARGTAHVGVLKVLEKLRIPVHCIAGTSLGSVVGALYSLGLDAGEIERVVDTVDWNRGFVDEFPRELLPLRRKDEEDEFLIKFELGIRDKTLNLPRGVIQGHSLHLLLKELVGGGSLVKDFDQLPIPFRAVATDIVTAESVPVAQGDLARAIQASMAIPGVFAPVEIEGRLLVDGGVTQNLPVSVVREMGADIVIAVDIGTPLTTRYGLTSVVAILDQLTNVLTQKNVEQEVNTLKPEDVYIQPDLGPYKTLDFAAAREIVAIGEAAANLSVESLKPLHVTEDEYKRFREQLAVVPALPNVIKSTRLRQQSRLTPEVLASRLNIGDDEQGFEANDFHDSLNTIYSTGLFESVRYEFLDSGSSIDVIAEKKTWGPDLIRFGFSLEEDFSGNNNFGISVGYMRKAINSRGGDIRAIGEIGETPRVLLEYFQPLETLGSWYTLTQFEHQQYSQGLFTGDSQTGEFRTRRNEFGQYAGYQFSNHSDVRAGIRFASGQVARRVGDISFAEREDFAEGSAFVGYRYDTLDSRRFPSSGGRVRLSVESSLDSLGADDEFDAVTLDALGAVSVGENRIVGSASFQTVTRNELPSQKLFRRGGLLDTSGLSQDVQVGQHVGRMTLVAYRPFSSRQIEALNFPVFYGASAGIGGLFQQRDEIDADRFQLSGNLFVAADTPAGPAFLGVGIAEGQGLSALLSLGVTF